MQASPYNKIGKNPTNTGLQNQSRRQLTIKICV